MGDKKALISAFVDRYGRETYADVLAHAGSHALPAGADEDTLPDEESDLFLYAVLEIAEHECGDGHSDCTQPLDDEDVFQFLLSHHLEVAERIDRLPSRGATQRRGDLGLIYPTMETADIRAEVESDVVEDGFKSLSVLGHDQRVDAGGEESLRLVCLVPCTNSVTEPETIPEKYPTVDGEPEFTDHVTNPVDIVVPVPKDVWKITSVIAPGFMTLDGWDVDSEEPVQAQIGVVSTDNPSKSRALLNTILGDSDDWPPGDSP